MPSYLALMNWTDQGIRSVKDSPSRVEAARKAIEAAGGRMIFFYMLLGEYDMASLAEFPNDEAGAKFLLALGSQGNVRTTTMRAFTEEETRNLVASL